MSNNDQQPDFLPEISRGRIKELKLYEISDDELARLEQGSEQSLFLALGIAVLSAAVSFLIALFATTITPDRVFYVFVIVTVVGFVAGIILIILAWYTRKPISKLVQRIRDRLPPEGEAQQLAPP